MIKIIKKVLYYIFCYLHVNGMIFDILVNGYFFCDATLSILKFNEARVVWYFGY